MALTFVSSTPSASDTDVYINKSLLVTFNKALNSDTIHQGTISVIDLSTGVAANANISISPTNTSQVVILPLVHLRTNTNYRIVLVGSDQAIGEQVEASDGEVLTTSVFIEFTTGTSVFDIDTTVEKDAADKTLEGDLFLPTNLKALGHGFVIESVRPKNHAWNVEQSLTGDNTIRFTFSQELLTGQDYTTWADLNVYPILNNDEYLASGSTIGSEYAIPDYSISVTGSDLLITFDNNLPKNTSIFVQLTNNITTEDGTSYGGSMAYSIITQLYPSVGGVDMIKREVSPVASAYTDDYIAATLFKNTIWLWEKTGRAIDIDNLPYAAKQYVIYETILNLLEDADLAKWLKAGVRRTLGDFAVQVDTYLGKMTIKIAKYQKLKEAALETIYKGWQFKVGSFTTAYSDALSDISRLWYNVNNRYTDPIYKFYQEDIPGSNVTLNRWAKTNNPWWW